MAQSSGELSFNFGKWNSRDFEDATVESVHVAEMAFCMLPLRVSSIHAVNFWQRLLWPISLVYIFHGAANIFVFTCSGYHFCTEAQTDLISKLHTLKDNYSE